MRLFVLLFAMITSFPAFASEQTVVSIDCRDWDATSKLAQGFILDISLPSKNYTIREYKSAGPIAVETGIKSGKLQLQVNHFANEAAKEAGDTDAIVQVDYHELDEKSGELHSRILKGGSDERSASCKIDFELPESDEKCAYWRSDADLARGGRQCVSNHLAAYKDNTYGANALMRDGAWCGLHSIDKPMKATIAYYGYGIYAQSAAYARLRIGNGYDKNDSVFAKNARAKTIIVSSGNFFQEAYVLKDTMEEQYLDFGENLTFEELEIEVVDTYPGTAFEHVCISSINADFEYDPEFGSYIDNEVFATKISIADANALKRGESENVPTSSASAPSFLNEVPNPTMGLSREEKPTPLTISQYKMHFGWPEKIADYSIQTAPQMKFAIIDRGFSGLEEFLRDNPDPKVRVTYVDRGGAKEKPDGTHGFDVFKVAKHVIPAGEILLIDVSHANSNMIDDAIDVMNERGFYYGTMSIGSFGRVDRSNLSTQTPSFLEKLEKTQTTLFVSAGNYRGKVHSAHPIDADNDGFIEFWPNEKKDSKRERLLFGVRKGKKTSIDVSWGKRPNATGEVVATIRRSGLPDLVKTWSEAKGFKNISIPVPDKDTVHQLSVQFKNLSGHMPFLRIREASTTSFGPRWNGIRSNGDYAIWDSPFLIPVGAVGELGSKLSPSSFSSIDLSPSGEVQPLVHGPGQIDLDGKTLNGTSFATPFIAALYSPFGAFNIKNYIEQTTSFNAYADGLSKGEVSRWGTPDFAKLLAVGGNECLVKKTRLALAKVQQERIEVDFEFSRNCMEAMDYLIGMRFETVDPNPETGRIENVTVTKDGAKRVYFLTARDHSKDWAITDKTIKLAGDFGHIDERFKGRFVQPVFLIATKLNPMGTLLVKSDVQIKLGD